MADPLRTRRVVVVGAGIGGLCSALVLAHRGLDVSLVEAAATPGGKIRQTLVDGVDVDAGPTVFTMRWVLEQMLAEMGTSLQDILTLEPIGVLARHAWRGSTQQLDLLADSQASGIILSRVDTGTRGQLFHGSTHGARIGFHRILRIQCTDVGINY